MSQRSVLYRLQQIDSNLDTARSSLQIIDRKLADDAQIRSAQDNITDFEQKRQSEVKRLREAENKSYDTRIKIERSESSLYGGKIHNPKELQDLQNEVASLKRMITILEDKELEAMMAVEEAEANLSRANEALKEIQARQSEQNASLIGERSKLSAQIERLEAERKATLPSISAADLTLYEQLRKTRNGVAVVKISSRACAACGTTLTAALIQSVQSTDTLIRCPSCGRILFSG
jgi:predicted  nucleic acid-binding Zn-ribbon protein